MSFLEGELVILNSHAKTGLPNRVGEICTVETSLYKSPNYDYLVRFEDNETAKVKESELNKLTDKKKELITYVKVGHHVEYIPTNEVVLILKTDFLHGVAEVEFEDSGIQVVRMIALKKIEKETENMGESNNMIQEDLLELFFKHYQNQDNTYTLPKELLVNMLRRLYVEGE